MQSHTSYSRLILIGTALLLVVAVFVLSGCKTDAQTPIGKIQVSAAPAVERQVVDWDDFTGRLEAVQSVEIRPRVNGYIDSVNFKEGGTVQQGDLLFVIDPRPYRADLDKAEAELTRSNARVDLTRSDVARSEKLLGSQLISREQYDQRVNAAREADAAVASAKAAVESARLNLAYTRVTSPITGRVGQAIVTRGNLVSGGANGSTLLTTVVSLDPIYVSFDGDEQIYLKYLELARRGERPSSRDARNPVQMGLANESDYPYRGEMVFLDNQVDPRTGTIHARASFSNADGFLTPGLFARLRLLGSGAHPAVLVSESAIGTDQDQKFVYVIDNGAVAYRKVKLGRQFDGLRVITEGVSAGEFVVVNGVQRVRPGVAVNVERVAMQVPEHSDAVLADAGSQQ
jgi:RND family efflux transporter MFP subunit